MDNSSPPPVPPLGDTLFAFAASSAAPPIEPSLDGLPRAFLDSSLVDDHFQAGHFDDSSGGFNGSHFTSPDGRPANTFEAFTDITHQWGHAYNVHSLQGGFPLEGFSSDAFAAMGTLPQPDQSLSMPLRPSLAGQGTGSMGGVPARVAPESSQLSTMRSTEGPSLQVVGGPELTETNSGPLREPEPVDSVSRGDPQEGIEKIAADHNKRPEQIENMVFNGGADYLKKTKPNIWNAWSQYYS